MKLRVAVFVFLLSASALSNAEESSQNVQKLCDSPLTGEEIIACSSARLKDAETELNNVYRELRAVLKKRAEDDLDKSLVMTQRDWVKFRESHCGFDASYEGAGGSYISAKVGECMAGTAHERTKYLKSVLEYLK